VRRRKAGYEPPFDTRDNRIGTVRYETDNGREHVEPRGTARERAITCGEPADRLNPAVVEAMKEVDIDILREFPKPLTDDAVRDADVVITLGCGDAGPFYPGKRYLIGSWRVPRQAHRGGSPQP
jgi:hypothetical protein